MQNVQVVSDGFEVFFLTLQCLAVAFLLLHDWVQLGRLNNLDAIHREDSLLHRVFVTLLPVVPTAMGLIYSIEFFGQRYPHGLELLLWITYCVLVVGLLRAWWVPYLVVPDPDRAARYKTIFAGTHKFLPERHGMAPDTLHTFFHGITVATLISLFLRDRIAG